MTFTPEVYAQIDDGCKRSAARIVPIVNRIVRGPLGSVIDVGCGTGRFAQEFARSGWEHVVALDESCDPGVREGVSYRREDFNGDWTAGEQFDLAVCLEVAEHLPEPAGIQLIPKLCGLAPLILFSAAIPGQGGHGHLNEQWLSYWIRLFGHEGFFCDDRVRWEIWADDHVEPWYRQNTVMFVADSPTGDTVSFDVVHPAIWRWRTG